MEIIEMLAAKINDVDSFRHRNRTFSYIGSKKDLAISVTREAKDATHRS